LAKKPVITSMAAFESPPSESVIGSMAAFEGLLRPQPQGNPCAAKIVARRFPAHSSRLLDAPQRPAQPTQCDDLFSFFSAQDVAHDHRG
jgi:hypothetical protein